jgi:hypothetical protein
MRSGSKPTKDLTNNMIGDDQITALIQSGDRDGWKVLSDRMETKAERDQFKRRTDELTKQTAQQSPKDANANGKWQLPTEEQMVSWIKADDWDAIDAGKHGAPSEKALNDYDKLYDKCKKSIENEVKS